MVLCDKRVGKDGPHMVLKVSSVLRRTQSVAQRLPFCRLFLYRVESGTYLPDTCIPLPTKPLALCSNFSLFLPVTLRYPNTTNLFYINYSSALLLPTLRQSGARYPLPTIISRLSNQSAFELSVTILGGPR